MVAVGEFEGVGVLVKEGVGDGVNVGDGVSDGVLVGVMALIETGLLS